MAPAVPCWENLGLSWPSTGRCSLCASAPSARHPCTAEVSPSLFLPPQLLISLSGLLNALAESVLAPLPK